MVLDWPRCDALNNIADHPLGLTPHGDMPPHKDLNLGLQGKTVSRGTNDRDKKTRDWLQGNTE